MSNQGQWVDTPGALAAALDALADAPWVAVDTEFVRERSYWARLCVVQLGTPQAAVAIDALAMDLAPLWRFLADPAREKVLHSADQDCEIFVQHADAVPRPLFDTQIAAGLLGIGDQIGYAALVCQRLSIQLDKSLSRTDWARRPVEPRAIDYALADVVHLAALYPGLRSELESRGRLDWLREDCEALADASRYRPDPGQAWRRLKGLGRLPPAAQHLAARLADWREREAIASDRPRRWVLPDDALLEIALHRPAPGALRRIDFGRGGSKTREAVARLIRDGLYDAPVPAGALVSDRRPEPEDRKAVSALAAKARRIAGALEVPVGMLAPRAELVALWECGAKAPLRLLSGWRREIAGEALLALRERLRAGGA